MAAELRLERGQHGRHEIGGCLLEVVSLLLGRRIVRGGRVKPDWLWDGKTDQPGCISQTVAHAGRKVNDLIDDVERHRLAPLIPLVMRAHRVDPGSERRIALRVALWAARSADHLVDPGIHVRFEAALAASEARLWDSKAELDNCEWVFGAGAVFHAAARAGENPYAAISELLEAIALAGEDLVLFLEDLLAAWEKAMVEEGLALDDPTIDYPDDDDVNAVIEAILDSGRHYQQS